MNNNKARVLCLLLSTALASGALAGDLTPPPGAVAPTMITLQEAEPSIPISLDDLPLFITEPGAYHLTENLLNDGSGGEFADCIYIDAPHVFLDLNGFSIGANGSLQWVNGIVISTFNTNVHIQNGIIYESLNHGIDGGLANSVTVEHVDALRNGESGIRLGNFAIVRSCRAIDNKGDGIICGVHALVEGSVALNNIPDVSGHSGYGIRVSNNGIIRECGARWNDLDGIYTGSACIVKDCYSEVSGLDGVSAGPDSRISNCIAKDNRGNGFSSPFGGASFTECTAAANQANGFDVLQSVIENCIATDNRGHGIDARAESRISNCTSNENFETGIRIRGGGCRVDSNTASFNTTGFDVSGNANLVIRNAATGSTILNYSIVLGTTGGAISGDPATAGPWDNISF